MPLREPAEYGVTFEVSAMTVSHLAHTCVFPGGRVHQILSSPLDGGPVLDRGPVLA